MQAIEQDCGYLKAWQRRASVRKHLGNTMGCLDDLQHALLLAPSSAAIAHELRTVLQARVLETGLHLPEDLIEVPVSIEDAPGAGSASKAQPGTLSHAGQSSDRRAHSQGAAEDRAQQPDRSSAEKSAGSTTDEAASVHQAAVGEPGVSPASSCSRPLSAASGRSVSGRSSPLYGLKLPVRPLRAPSTGADFESSWRGLKGDADAQARYLRLIAPDALPRILKSSLSPHLLDGIVGTALQLVLQSCSGGGEMADAERGVRVLRGLVSTQRFAMNAMLIPGARRNQLREAWDAATASAASDEHKDVLATLRPLYKV